MGRLLLGVVCALLLACQSQEVNRIEGPDISDGWRYEQKFSYEINKSAIEEVLIEVNHSTDYPYENLYLKLQRSDANSSAKIISIPLTDQKGLWQGECTTNQCIYRHPIDLSIVEKEAVITLEQYSRDTVLTGLNQINLLTQAIEKK